MANQISPIEECNKLRQNDLVSSTLSYADVNTSAWFHEHYMIQQDLDFWYPTTVKHVYTKSEGYVQYVYKCEACAYKCEAYWCKYEAYVFK